LENFSGPYSGTAFARKSILEIKYLQQAEQPDYAYCYTATDSLSKMQTKSLKKLFTKNKNKKGILYNNK